METKVKADVNVERVVRNAVIQLIHDMPFYGHILSQLPKRITEEVSTFGVGKASEDSMLISLYVSPSYVNRLYSENDNETAFNHIVEVLKHEVLHVIFRHLFIHLPNAKLKHIAAELSVNSYIDISKIIGKCITPEQYKFEKRLGILEYYKLLEKNNKKNSNSKGSNGNNDSSGNQGNNQSCSNSDSSGNDDSSENQESNQSSSNDSDSNGNEESTGSGNKKKKQSRSQKNGKSNRGGDTSKGDSDSEDSQGNQDGNQGHQLDSHNTWRAAHEKDISDSIVKDIVRKAKDSVYGTPQWGDLPAEIREYVNELTGNNGPIVPWQTVLRDFVASSSEIVLDYTNKRVSKRFGTRPGTCKQQILKLAVGIDTSASVDAEMIEMFFNELYWMSKELCDITIFECDTQIHRETPFSQFEFKDVIGRGGTDLEPVFKEASERKFDALIFFTDAFTSNFKEEYFIPTMAVIVGFPYYKSLSELPFRCDCALQVLDDKQVQVLN